MVTCTHMRNMRQKWQEMLLILAVPKMKPSAKYRREHTDAAARCSSQARTGGAAGRPGEAACPARTSPLCSPRHSRFASCAGAINGGLPEIAVYQFVVADCEGRGLAQLASCCD